MISWHGCLHALLSLSIVSSVRAAGEFIYPGPPTADANEFKNWELGSIQAIRWSTNSTSYDITLFQGDTQTLSGHEIDAIHSVFGDGAGNDKSFDWKVQTYGNNISEFHTFTLQIHPTNGDPDIVSAAFNIVEKASSPSSMQSESKSTSIPSSVSPSTISSSITSTPTPSSTSIIASTTSSTSLPHAQSDPNDVPTTLKVALGIGLGIGIPLVLIIGVWVVMSLVHQRRTPPQNRDVREDVVHLKQASEQYHIIETPQNLASDEVYEMGTYRSRAELEGDGSMHKHKW